MYALLTHTHTRTCRPAILMYSANHQVTSRSVLAIITHTGLPEQTYGYEAEGALVV